MSLIDSQGLSPFAKRTFEVSARGDSCGLALLHVRSPKYPVYLRIDILPKFWGAGEMVVINLDELEDKADSRHGLQVIVHEKQLLQIVGLDAERVRAVGNALVGIRVKRDDDEDEYEESDDIQDRGLVSEPNLESVRSNDPQSGLVWKNTTSLFKEVAQGLESRCEPAGPSVGSTRDFWRLFMNSDMPPDRIKTPNADDLSDSFSSQIASQLLKDVPELRIVLRRTFLREASLLARRLRPMFTESTQEIGTIRGKVVIPSLIKRTYNASPTVECTFDELDTSSPWYELVRATNAIVLIEEQQEKQRIGGDDIWVDLSARIDFLLRPIVRIPVNHVLIKVAKQRIPRKLREFESCFKLAILLLREQSPIGATEEEIPNETGVVTSLRVSTSKLFEYLLNGRPVGQNYVLQLKKDPIQIRKEGFAKKPDLEIVGKDLKDSRVLIDAKYKSAPNSLSSMAFSDQYQQYSYAASSGMHTFFVYLNGGAMFDDLIKIRGIVSAIRVGFVSIEFPNDSDLDMWWNSQELKFVELVQKIVQSS